MQKLGEMVAMLVTVVFALAFAGCGDTLARLESKPTALGSTNQIVVVADNNVWTGPTGDTLVYYFGSPYPIMPTPEPLFDLRHFTIEDLQADALRKELRTYMYIANLNDRESPVTRAVIADLGEENIRKAKEDTTYISTVGHDKWARGQLIIYIFGFGLEELQGNITEAFPYVSRRIRDHDSGQLHAATYLDGVSQQVSGLIRDKFKVSLEIPGDYDIAVNDENFLWIRKDTRDLTSSIAIRRFKYQSEDQMSKEGIINMRNRLGLLVQGASIGSFMQTNDRDLPVFTYNRELDGHYAIESRGVWELTEDYLGGPFLNYAIVNGDEILMIDAFAYAPGKDKRDYIQQLEYVITRADLLN